MKRLRVYTFWGILFVSVLGTILHFAYEFSGKNFIVGLFTPVNESTWEHMKLLFFPMLLFSALAKNKLKAEYPCIGSATALGTICGTLLIPVLFYTYTGALGFNTLILDISTFYISVLAAFCIAYKNATSCKAENCKNLLSILLVIFILAFVIFTHFPPNIALFEIPQ